ncbi:MAG: quinolinate synthase NadA [bacterium]
MANPVSDFYNELSEAELKERVLAVKDKLGPELLVLTHHYQSQDIVDLGDFSGDSFALSKKAAEQAGVRYIVFCGVRFMAESAALLARDDQAVFLPNPEAGCPMADMVDASLAEKAWQDIGEVVSLEQVVPITYVNSNADVKAFCGRNGGAACTSSNADKVFKWAYNKADKVLFMPDEHLGRNTAADLAIEPVALYEPGKELGGLGPETVRSSPCLVWKGYCFVHTRFTTEMVEKARNEYPGCKVIVHPECKREVVEASDASGSTEQIIKYVEDQPEGSVIIIGTEKNLVDRLARRYRDTKTVVPLTSSTCVTMARITLPDLCRVLESLIKDKSEWIGQVSVSDDIKQEGALALQRMLDIVSE